MDGEGGGGAGIAIGVKNADDGGIVIQCEAGVGEIFIGGGSVNFAIFVDSKRSRGGRMDAAKVENEMAVEIDPSVVVGGENESLVAVADDAERYGEVHGEK